MSSSLEIQFITKVIHGGDLTDFNNLLKHGFSEDIFGPPYKDIIKFINTYRQKYHQLPTEEEILKRFESLEKKLIFSPKVSLATLRAIYDALINQACRVDIVAFSEELAKEFAVAKDSVPLLEKINLSMRKLDTKYARAKGRIHTLADMSATLREDMERTMSGLADGIPIPFSFIQEEMRGWQPAQITSVLAKTGVGKTWFLLLCAIAAASGDPHFYDRYKDIQPLTEERKKELRSKVLVVSCEMPVLDISRRLGSLYSKVSFNRIKSGKLTHEEKELYFRKLDELMFVDKDGKAIGIGHNIRILGPDLAGTPEQIMAQADDFKADIVLVDGFYYMSGSGEKRWERVESNMQQMRLHTLISNRHYILASQFRRDAKALKSSSADDIAFSMSIGQDSNNLIGLYQPPYLRQLRQMDINELKSRDGTPDLPYRFTWDLYEMKFVQVGRVEDVEKESSESAYS